MLLRHEKKKIYECHKPGTESVNTEKNKNMSVDVLAVVLPKTQFFWEVKNL
jgi:hypothetical protein